MPALEVSFARPLSFRSLLRWISDRMRPVLARPPGRPALVVTSQHAREDESDRPGAERSRDDHHSTVIVGEVAQIHKLSAKTGPEPPQRTS
jgi:hypothetical protein